MCTIIVLRNVNPEAPLVLATNRDEFYARRSSGPERISEQPVAVGGRDLEGGGTWMGVTREGLFVGVTNQRTFGVRDSSKRSRGELVMQALSRERPERILAWLKGIDAREYNAFNLMFGDAHDLYVAYGREQTRSVEIEPVPSGVHVLPNDRLDSPAFAKVARARALLAPLSQRDLHELSQELMGVLADGELPALELLPEPPPGALLDKPLLQRLAALCVRTPVYGTRSSTIVGLSPDGVQKYLYADGPPDSTPFADVTPLFTHALS